MSTVITTRRKNALNLFREAQKLASFDEYPLLRPEVDPQLHASRNSVDQPFYLTCEKDSLLVQMSGRARVSFQEGGVRYFDMSPGDYVYVPGGIPHKVATLEIGVQFRYKARDAGLEQVEWYCDQCGEGLDQYTWDTKDSLPQTGYQFACERHNADVERRQCKSCGANHDVLDLSLFRWDLVADALVMSDDQTAENF